MRLELLHANVDVVSVQVEFEASDRPYEATSAPLAENQPLHVASLDPVEVVPVVTLS